MKKIFFALLSVLAVSLLGFGLVSHARAEEKVAFVNLQRAINEVEEGKRAKASIQADMDAKKKQLDSMKAGLKKMRDDLEKQKTVLSKEAMEAKAGEIQTKFMELQQKAIQYDQELKQKESASVQKILEALKVQVVALAKQKNYTIVYENSADVILYSAKGSDITGELIQAYNKK